MGNNTIRKRKYPTKTKFSSAPLQKPENSSIIQVCTFLYFILEYSICKKGSNNCHDNYICISVSLPVTSFGFCEKPSSDNYKIHE
jgi:hypothetical protein